MENCGVQVVEGKKKKLEPGQPGNGAHDETRTRTDEALSSVFKKIPST